jgi:hypothetical protein
MSEIIESIEWVCPECGFVNGLQIDDEMGPVLQDICGLCDTLFLISELKRSCLYEKPS